MASRIIKGEGTGEYFDPTVLEWNSERKVIPGEFLTASEEARQLIQKAKEESARICKRAEAVLADAVREKEEERERGYREGYEEGQAELAERLVSFEAEREKVLAGQEKEIVEMVLEIAEKIVGNQLERGGVASIVRQAVSKAVGERLVIHVHPDDLQILEAIKDFGSLTLFGDPAVTPGGCLIESELGTVDARLEIQWKAIRKALGIEEER
ncbi:MAG: type III secretion system stator protein SctL [Deltaproteobacteria bacterium]|nr:type III secretion system stator protein SctL [Deltaproteobacteria bacterium]